jgi:hypothetical protein
MNAIRWFMKPRKRNAGDPFYWNDYEPLKNPPVPTHVLLGYANGSSDELVYDLAAGTYLRRSLHYDEPPLNSDHSLVGMLRNFVYEE